MGGGITSSDEAELSWKEISNQTSKLFLSHQSQKDWFKGLAPASHIALENLWNLGDGEDGFMWIVLLLFTELKLLSSLFSLFLSSCTLCSYHHSDRRNSTPGVWTRGWNVRPRVFWLFQTMPLKGGCAQGTALGVLPFPLPAMLGVRGEWRTSRETWGSRGLDKTTLVCSLLCSALLTLHSIVLLHSHHCLHAWRASWQPAYTTISVLLHSHCCLRHREKPCGMAPLCALCTLEKTA